jgi:hypothetical protein
MLHVVTLSGTVGTVPCSRLDGTEFKSQQEIFASPKLFRQAMGIMVLLLGHSSWGCLYPVLRCWLELVFCFTCVLSWHGQLYLLYVFTFLLVYTFFKF